MRTSPSSSVQPSQPLLLDKAQQLGAYLKTLSPSQLAKIMNISSVLAEKTHDLVAAWTTNPENQSLAIDSFVGDIYSGLHANDLSPEDRDYANNGLRILSGLYGILRPFDGICPYRLEMGYKLPEPAFANLYNFWGRSIMNCLPPEGPIINLAAAEYAQAVTQFIDTAAPKTGYIVAPRFLTVNPKTGEPGFVVVHAKIARGAFARWLITNRIEHVTVLSQFNSLGYRFVKELSTPDSPTFVCETFGGKGLSIRLNQALS